MSREGDTITSASTLLGKLLITIPERSSWGEETGHDQHQHQGEKEDLHLNLGEKVQFPWVSD